MKQLLYTGIIALTLAPHLCAAASITFDPQGTAVGTGQPFKMAVNLSADEVVNALELTIIFPEGFRPVDVSDGNSIISLWIDEPHYDEATHRLTLSGLMPGGFSGHEGRILLIDVEAQLAAAGTFSVDNVRSHILLNSPTAEEAKLDSASVTVEARDDLENLDNELRDGFPPEDFTPELLPIPGNEQNRMLVFATQDKHSGVLQYEVRERNILLPWRNGTWKIATSPYELSQSGLTTRFDVRATDKEGNSRIATVRDNSPQARIVDILLALLYALGILIALDALRRTITRT